MTDKQKLFISEYLKDFNATQAAIRAGYSEDTAKSIGCENLTKPDIKEEINKQLDTILADNKDIAVKVVRECSKIAFAQLTDFVEYDENGVTFKPTDNLDTAALEMIQFDEKFTKDGSSRTKRIKLHDKLKALDILAKYTALYKDTVINNNFINTSDKRITEILTGDDINRLKDE